MPVPVRRRIGARTLDLSPQEELEVRHTGEPAETLAALEAIDAANTSRLSALYLDSALHAREQADDVLPAYRHEVLGRALFHMTCAQRTRR